MKKFILLFFIFSVQILLAQTVKGTVVNDIDTPISQVNIYLDGTKTGTVSAADGSFNLQIPDIKNGVLVFQKENYDTYTINISEVFNKKLKVVLTKTKEIEEVKIIPYTEATYKKYINYFLSSFIGGDQENVKIKNQRSLKFSYDKENKILKVKAPQTLIIENKNLGYTIDYNLVEFTAEFNNRITRFYGTSFFKENKNTDKMKLNRMNAFEGSQVHFFRSVFNKKTKEEGFVVNQITKFPNPERKSFEPEYKIAITKLLIPESDYTKNDDGKLILDYDYMMQINYKKFYYEIKGKNFVKSQVPIVQTSYLHPEGETFEISSDGNTSNPGMLTNQGEFANNKIENLLPLDYKLGD